MIALAVGDFRRFASGQDASGRTVSVWAPSGATQQVTLVPWELLSNATGAWEDMTGQSLPMLDKLDMLVLPGGTPWSTAAHGLLLMDRFRTLWTSRESSASDLVRAAHIICHETGHLWFGGLLQILDTEGIAFIQVVPWPHMQPDIHDIVIDAKQVSTSTPSEVT